MNIYQRQIFGILKQGFIYYSGKSKSISAQDNAPNGLSFKPDGTKMYVVGNQNDTVYEYNLSTAWDVSTAVYSVGKSISAQENFPSDLYFKPDGTKMYVVGTTSDTVYEYNLSTAWDVSTAVYSVGKSISAQDNSPLSIAFNSDGTELYISGGSTVCVYRYILSTAWDVSTAVYKDFVNVSSQDLGMQGLFVKPDDSNLYMAGSLNDSIYEFIFKENF